MNLEKYNKDMEEVFDVVFQDYFVIKTGLVEDHKEAIKSFIKSSHKALLKKIAEEEVERNQKQASIHQEIIDTHTLAPFKWHEGRRDEALANITHWKEIISKLNEE